MKKNTDQVIKKLTAFFYEIGTLRKIMRSHRQALLTDDLSDNISSHSYRVTIIGYFLALEMNTNIEKVLKMCLFHDVSETRSGDQNWVNKKYVKVFDQEVEQEQFSNLPNKQELLALLVEYHERKTADLLDQILLLKEYYLRGNIEAKDWLKTSIQKNAQQKLLSTNLAKQIAIEIKKQRPSDWWNNI